MKMFTTLLPAFITLVLVAGLAAIVLSLASKRFRVKQDPRIAEILEALPGANCGGCGFGGCAVFAEEIVKGHDSTCPVADEKTKHMIAGILGLEVVEKEPHVARVFCSGTCENANISARFQGLFDCRAAKQMGQSDKSCTFACYGLKTCEDACPFGAIKMENGIAVVDSKHCTSCGRCVDACPQNVISLVFKKTTTTIACSSRDKGAVARNNCKVACIGCMKCVKECPVEAIKVEDFLAVIDYEKCINCKKCIEVCPMNTIKEVG